MASYKVPQDVEADDKLIGPFSFRQFIYLIVVAISGAIAWVLGQVFIPLAVIPLPVILLFGALALPLRKDQPMETYLAAIISFYLKPHRRLWDPDGQQSLIEIVAPKIVDGPRTNGLSENEAEQRLSYLASLVDSRGWAVRGISNAPQTNSAVNADIIYEAQQAEDVLDQSNRTSHLIDDQLNQANARHRQALMSQMQAPAQPQTVAAQPQSYQVRENSVPVNLQPQPNPAAPQLVYNPYPNAIQQKVIQPLQAAAPVAAAPTQPTNTLSASEKPLSPDIINLANNRDLSIETIAHEANRIQQKTLPEDEVVISIH